MNISLFFRGIKQVNFTMTDIVAIVAIVVSLWSLKKQYYDKFKIDIALNCIHMGIHEWDDGERYEVRVFVPMTIFNVSNAVGTIKEMRIKVIYRVFGVFPISEIYTCDYELKDEKKFDEGKYACRGNLIEKIAVHNFEEIYVSKGQQLRKHYLFRMFWQDSLRIMKTFKIILEVKTGKYLWRRYGAFRGRLTQMEYDMYVREGTTIEFGKYHNRIYLFDKMFDLKQKIIKQIFGQDIVMKEIKLPPSKSKW